MLCNVIVDLLALVTLRGVFHSADAVFHNDSSGGARHGSCRLRSVREIGDKRSRGSMTQSFFLDDIEYKLCRYDVTWDEALVFCSTHEAHLATLDDDEKTLFVAQAIASSNSASEDYWIGARKYYDDVWTWDSSAKKLDSRTFVVRSDVPIVYPDEDTDEVRCLTIDRTGHSDPVFVPRTCNQRRGFICQRESDRTFDGKMRMVAASRIGEEEFRLYSGRATWAEAVVQCRQEGLEIAEVATVEQARALAVSMLRNRPGIESAWIGGYTRKNEPSTWRWLASGEKIRKSEMWRDNFTESSDGCLLLDRHLCEIPIYVNTRCDRRRDVLCQKPPRKRFGKKPTEAIVDGCRYWIGFYPAKWSDAERSCERFNSSLVVLDSPETISHVMRLMLDNRAELRHVWTDGRRAKKNGQWRWRVNGRVVPAFGSSLISWCSEEDYNRANGFDCLNLDRENLDSPLVYGLSCDEKQSYVCQPHFGECVRHSVTSSTLQTSVETTVRAVALFDENLQNFQRSGVTGTMTVIEKDNDMISTTIDSARFTGDQRETLSLKNSTSGGNLSNYLSPLSRLTLPSFPQFGIKVASALETSVDPAVTYDGKRNKKIKQYFTTSSSATTARPSYSAGPTSSVALKRMTIGAMKTQPVRSKKVEQSSVTSFLEATTFPPRRSKGHSSIAKITTTEKVPVAGYPSKGKNVVNTRTEKTSIGEISQPSYTLRRITASLQKKHKKPGFATGSATPYDAIDEDYYDNPEAARVTERYHQKGNVKFKDEYDANYDEETDNIDVKKATKPPKSRPTVSTKRPAFETHRKNNNKDKIKKIDSGEKRTPASIPIIQELSKNLQDALVGMLKQGIERKKDASAETKTVKSTTRSLREKMTIFRDNPSVESLSRMRSNTENHSIRPYYAFEGPMIVELADDARVLKNSEFVDDNGRVRDFKFIVKDKPGSSSRNKKIPSSKYRESRRRNKAKISREKSAVNDMSIVVAGLPPIRPNDPDSMMKMGYYIKDKFADVLGSDENSGDEGRGSPNDYRDGREKKPKWPQRRYREKDETPRDYDENQDRGRYDGDDEFPDNEEGYENANFHSNSDGSYYQEDPEGRKSPRDDEELPVTPSALRESSAGEDSLQERLKISWPDDDNFTGLNVLRYDESASDRSFLPPVRTTRSFDRGSSVGKSESDGVGTLGDLKISKLIKELKVDVDQRSLRKYLEAFAKKVVKDDVYYRKDDWKDTWRYVLRRMAKIFDRMSVNVNGETMKIRIASDESRDFEEIDRARKIEWMKKLRKRKKDFTNFVRNISRKTVPTINGTKVDKNNTRFNENPDVTDMISAEDKPALSTEASSIMTSENEPPSSETWMRNNVHGFSGWERYFPRPQVKPDTMMSLERPPKPEMETPSRYDETIVMDLRKKHSQPQRSFPEPPMSDKTIFRGPNDEVRLENVYGTKYENFNDSHILAAPAVARPMGAPKVYNFQPIMQQLHHRLAFNQGLAQFRPDPRTNNMTEKMTIFRDENLRKILGGDYEDPRRYPGEDDSERRPEVTSSADDDEASEDEDSQRGDGRQVEDKLETGDSSYRVEDNETVSESDDREAVYEVADENSDSLDKDYPGETVWSPTIHLRDSMESLNRPGRSSRRTRNEENLRKLDTLGRNDRRSDNDRGRDEIVKNLEYLTREPSIVSLRIIIHSDEKDPTTMKRSEDFTRNSDDDRTVELRLKFSGSQQALDERDYSRSTNDAERKLDDSSFNRTSRRRISSRLSGKIRERAMLQKLRDMSRKIAAKNYTLSWRKENGSTIVDMRDRKSRDSGINENRKSPDETRDYGKVRRYSTGYREKNEKKMRSKMDWNDRIASLFTSLKENDDKLTLYINLTLGEFETKLERGKTPET